MQLKAKRTEPSLDCLSAEWKEMQRATKTEIWWVRPTELCLEYLLEIDLEHLTAKLKEMRLVFPSAEWMAMHWAQLTEMSLARMTESCLEQLMGFLSEMS